MSVNTMNFNQASTVLNAIHSQVTGKTALAPIDDRDWVSVATETLAVTCTGDNATGVTMAVFKPADTGYATLFTAPTAPAI